VLQQPPLGVLLRARGGMQCALFLAQVAGDLLLGAEAAEHAERQDRNDHQQQQARHQRNAAFGSPVHWFSRHVCSPARFITSMTRSTVIVCGWFACGKSGLAKVSTTRTALTLT